MVRLGCLYRRKGKGLGFISTFFRYFFVFILNERMKFYPRQYEMIYAFSWSLNWICWFAFHQSPNFAIQYDNTNSSCLASITTAFHASSFFLQSFTHSPSPCWFKVVVNNRTKISIKFSAVTSTIVPEQSRCNNWMHTHTGF